MKKIFPKFEMFHDIETIRTFFRRRLPYFPTVFFCVFMMLVFAFAIRGLPGNPTAEELMATEAWRSEGPLELSPERGRFALLYSIVEDGTPFFSLPVARLATPDLAMNSDGKFVSLFAPFLSFLLIPGYFIGKMLGASVLGATAVIAFFAIGNAMLIRAIAMRLGARNSSASLGALAFLFGTPAFAYGTTLYQHHVSVFLLLLSIASLLWWKDWRSLVVVAFFAGVSVSLDNPNVFLFAPIIFWAVTRIFWVKQSEDGSKIILFRPLRIFSFVFAIVPFGIFLWYNLSVNGDPLQLSGTLPAVPAISEDGRALLYDPNQRTKDISETTSAEKTAVGFFETRALLNGFSIHIASPDRGVIRFAPVILLGIAGLFVLYRRKKTTVANVLVGVSLTTLLLYSLWGDPWGGWAFGSRYLIPVYAMLGISLGIALEEWRRSKIFLALFCALFVVSISVNTLGVVTSNANPPQIQVLELEALSGKEEKYTVARNWQYLHESGSKSFFYQTVASRFMSAESYYVSLVLLILLFSIILFLGLVRRGNPEAHRI